ncbi:MAG: hypothetical protein AAGA26_06505 [Pseudomonadota bacterium]
MMRQSAIGQLPEIIYIDGVLYSLHTTPLLPWLRAQEPPHVFDQRTPQCERGYVAKWAIEDRQLWLVGLHAWRDGVYTGVPALFDDRAEVLADWFSGPLIVEPTNSAVREGEYPKPRTLFVKSGVLADSRC